MFWQLWPNHPPSEREGGRDHCKLFFHHLFPLVCFFLTFSQNQALNAKELQRRKALIAGWWESVWGGQYRGDSIEPFLPQDLNPWLSHRDCQKVLATHSKALPGLSALPSGAVSALWNSPGPGSPQGPQGGGPEALQLLPGGCFSARLRNWLQSKPGLAHSFAPQMFVEGL